MTVQMQGGALDIDFSPEGRVLMTGPVSPIFFQVPLHPEWRP